MLFQILQVSSVLLYMLNKQDNRGEVISACQFKSKKTGKPYWAIEVKWEPLELKVPILRKAEIPLPVPELGGIIHGVQFTTSYLEIEKLNKPEKFDRIVCKYRINEVKIANNDNYCRRSFYIEGGKQNAEFSKEKLKTIIENSSVDELVSNKWHRLLRLNIRIEDKDKVENIIKKFHKNQLNFCIQFLGVKSLPEHDFRKLEEEYLEEQRNLLRQYFPDIKPEDYDTIIKSMYDDDEPETPLPLITWKKCKDGTPRTIDNRKVDHRENRRDVATKKLRKEYPNLFNAMDGLYRAKNKPDKKKWAEKARRGFIVDLKKNTGIQLSAEGEAELLRDNAFINMLNEANEKPRKEPHPLDWELILGWIIKGYYKMNEQELAANIKRNIEYGSKETTIARHARKLHLETALKRGRPEKKEKSF